MFRKYAVPLLALILLSFAVVHVVRAHTTPEKAAPPLLPGRTPFTKTVAGAGLVEAQTQNIAVGSALSGLVMDVPVQVGQRVKAGTVLFRLDDRALKAELKIREANLSVARAVVHEPRLLVCDEPTAALDAQSGQTVMELLRRVAVQPGRAVIVVTHDSRVYKFGDRIVRMSDGQIDEVETQRAEA